MAVLANSGAFLPEVLQLGPTTGPFDFQFATDQLFGNAGPEQYLRTWQNYIDDFFVRREWRSCRRFSRSSQCSEHSDE